MAVARLIIQLDVCHAQLLIVERQPCRAHHVGKALPGVRDLGVFPLVLVVYRDFHFPVSFAGSAHHAAAVHIHGMTAGTGYPAA